VKKHIILALAAVLALAAFRMGEHSPMETGITSGNLKDTLVTDWIDMRNGDGSVSTQLTLFVDVTAGTTTQMRITCQASETEQRGWWLQTCRPAETYGDPGYCQKDDRKFIISGDTYIKSEWHLAANFIKCTLDDPDNGSGIVSVTATRTNL